MGLETWPARPRVRRTAVSIRNFFSPDLQGRKEGEKRTLAGHGVALYVPPQTSRLPLFPLSLPLSSQELGKTNTPERYVKNQQAKSPMVLLFYSTPLPRPCGSLLHLGSLADFGTSPNRTLPRLPTNPKCLNLMRVFPTTCSECDRARTPIPSLSGRRGQTSFVPHMHMVGIPSILN